MTTYNLEQLRKDLVQAIADCERFAIPAHMVRNCPSAIQDETQAWRRRQEIEYQISCLEKGQKIY